MGRHEKGIIHAFFKNFTVFSRCFHMVNSLVVLLSVCMHDYYTTYHCYTLNYHISLFYSLFPVTARINF